MVSAVMTPLLAVDRLVVELPTERGHVKVLDGVGFTVPKGGAVGLVGESGCGKSMTALAILGLLPEGARVPEGSIKLGDQDLTKLSESQMRGIRGRRAAMIFQEPMTALNPVLTVGEQVAEPLRVHAKLSRAAAWEKAIALFAQVGIPSPAERARAYPHQLSGGMRQRVLIAAALALDPELLIADEPTTALDVTIQAQILELLAKLRRDRGLALLLITHDLGVVAETCDEVVVMYAGQVVERAPARTLFASPRHPYTQGLLASLPPEPGAPRDPQARLTEIPGMVPPPGKRPPGCRFEERCGFATNACREPIPLAPAPGDVGREVRCIHPRGIA